jgi:hypothetical protein
LLALGQATDVAALSQEYLRIAGLGMIPALLVMVHIPVDPGSAEVTFTIKGRVHAEAPWATLLASAALTALADTLLTVDARLTAAGNSIAKAPIPAEFKVDVTVADAGPVTYAVYYCLSN